MLRKSLVFLSLLLTLSLTAQDTLKIMQYNLLYYGKNTTFCTEANNSMDSKNTALSTIINYAQPDIFCVNEIDASSSDADYLMHQVLNTSGITHWARANVTGSYLSNMMYYNSEKYHLLSQATISGNPRPVDVYNMALIADNTIQFTIFVAHLKAGNGDNEAALRASTTQNVMNYIAAQGEGNYLIMGDFNVYTSDEECFQNLINPSNPDIAFNDPINRLGDWSANYSYAGVHTQSTHTASSCFSGGGMDDRFDFILISDPIKEGANQIEYIQNSYETIGQDGNHYNDNLTDGSNNAAPSNVITALYNMSDHLPVSLKLKLNTNPPSAEPVTIFNKTFDNQDITSGGWQQISVLDDDRTWHIPATTYGHDNTYCCKMSGWDYDNNVSINNEDWLISPEFNTNETSSETLSFWTAGKYSGPDLEVYYSTDYSGTGNPNDANWTAFADYHTSTTLNYTWEASGDIDLSTIEGEHVYIAFKYRSTEAEGSRTWQVDDIKLVGETNDNSIAQKNTGAFKLYPNPVSDDVVQIELNNTDLKHQLVAIYNASGILIKQKTIASTKGTAIDISSFDTGVYYVKVGYHVQKLIIN